MSYFELNEDVTKINSDEVKKLLTDLAGRKEFAMLATKPHNGHQEWSGFGRNSNNLFLPGLKLNGAQLFVRNFENPDTNYKRLLIKWQTGAGKSIAAISIGNEFIKQYRARTAVGDFAPTIFIISFTARETIQEDMLRYPEFGFISQSEVEMLQRLRAAASGASGVSAEMRQLSSYLGVLRRRITDRSRGGYYQFYGYKEFANRLFQITNRGISNGFDIQYLYDRNEGTFSEKINEAVKRGDVKINLDLLESLKNGLLIADEIHNVYNILEKNNYGIAIQYVLDTLGDDAPRAVFMSATPMTGSAAEVVDLLNLLVPLNSLPNNAPLRRSDFFTRTIPTATLDEAESTFVISQLREGALEKIANYSAGRVSFLLDSDVDSYPRRIFVGDEYEDIPYLRLNLCPMSPFHERTLLNLQKENDKSGSSGLAVYAYTLYDLAFPNPDDAPDAAANSSTSLGIYNSSEVIMKLSQASEEWRSAAGVSVDRISSGIYITTGSFLEAKNLRHYSSKFEKILAETIAAIKAGPGKIMIYHHRVRNSGVLLMQEILRMNGFADETSAPTESTLCSVCGIIRSIHTDDNHTYMPARFIVAHSDIDRLTMIRSIAKYNDISNLNGYQFRVIIGSKIIREGLNFKAVRYQFVSSLPTDYPTLIQVFGRVVRKGSHNDLPYEQRDVKIKVFISTRRDGKVSPELQRYIDKGREFLVIQEVERVLHINAIDGFTNWDKIQTALKWTSTNKNANIDALSYTPLVRPENIPAVSKNSTFEIYGYGEREVSIISSICRVLFNARSVWRYNDLWAAIKSNIVKGVNYNPDYFSEGNFALALNILRRPTGHPPMAIMSAGDYYIKCNVNSDGSPIFDIESYLRDFPPIENISEKTAPPPPKITIKLSNYLRTNQSDKGFNMKIRDFEKEYLIPDAQSTPELSLIDYGTDFHFTLIRKLIESPTNKITIDDEKIKNVYIRFRIVITAADAIHVSHFIRGGSTKSGNDLIGYVTNESVSIYDFENKKWYNASHNEFGIGKRHAENNIMIGYVTSAGAQNDGAEIISSDVKFKIRPPIHKLKSHNQTTSDGKRVDIRTLSRGAVCETRTRDELRVHVRKLREILLRYDIKKYKLSTTELGGLNPKKLDSTLWGDVDELGDIKINDPIPDSKTFNTSLSVDLDYIANFDLSAQKRFPSAIEMCTSIRLYLLALEEYSRAPVNGMMDGIRWLYLFNDKPPSISAI